MDTEPTAPSQALMMPGPAFAHAPQALQLFASAEAFALGQRMAMMLSNSSIIPDTYRRNFWDSDAKVWKENADAVGNCFIALELAQRLGTSPLVVMQQVDMIHGRPALRGTFLIALVNGSDQFTELDFEQRTSSDLLADEPDDEAGHAKRDQRLKDAAGDGYGYRAVAISRATGKPKIGPWITWAMVKGEKWDSKTGSKWKTMPELMFQYRAAAFWSRLHASHITLGLYEAEEAAETFGIEEVVGQAVGRGEAGAKVSRLALLNARTEGADGAKDAEPALAKAARKKKGTPVTIDQGSTEDAVKTEGAEPGEVEPLAGKPVDGEAALADSDNEAELAETVADADARPEPAGTPIEEEVRDEAEEEEDAESEETEEAPAAPIRERTKRPAADFTLE